MKSPVALICLAFLMSSSSAMGSATDPVAKVLEMLSGLQAKIIAEAEGATKVYDEFAEWCEDKSKKLGFEIKTAQGEIEQLQAEIVELTATMDECSTKIDELTGKIATDEADLKAATEIRAKEEAAFAAEEKELMDIVDTLERAIAILEREMKKGASMLQLQNAGSVAQALQVMVQASAFSSADATRLTALLQSSQDESDNSAEAPAAAAYEGHSGGIIATMEGLLEKAEAQLAACRKTEAENLHNFEVLKQSLTDELNFGNDDLAKAKKCVKEAEAAKSTAEGGLSVTSKDLAEDEKTKATLHSDCMTKATEYEQEAKDRDEELKALAGAKEAIAKGTGGEGGAADQAYGLEQVSLLQTSRSRENQPNDKAVRFIRDMARRENLPELAQLASRMVSALRMGVSKSVADPFEKVKGLIEEMIVRLEKQAAAEAAHKAYCDKEFKETYAKEEDKNNEIDKLTSAINKAKARSALLKGEVATLTKELADLASSQQKADSIRAEEKALFDKNSAEMKQGLEGVKLALKILREFYGKGEGAQGAGGTIIGLIEVIESDFEKLLSEMTADEESSAAAYEKLSKENEVTLATKEQDVKYKTKEFTGLDKTITELSSDLAGVEEELSAVLEYLEKIKEACIAKPETYEERKKRREQEIAGLKAGLEILEGEAVLLQTSSTVKSLRGLRA